MKIIKKLPAGTTFSYKKTNGSFIYTSRNRIYEVTRNKQIKSYTYKEYGI